MTLEELEFSIREYQDALDRVESHKNAYTSIYPMLKANLNAAIKKSKDAKIEASLTESERSLGLKLLTARNIVGGEIIFSLKHNGAVACEISIPIEIEERDDITFPETITIGKKYPKDITSDFVIDMIGRFYKEMTKWKLSLG